jgi:hypothetical protein
LSFVRPSSTNANATSSSATTTASFWDSISFFFTSFYTWNTTTNSTTTTAAIDETYALYFHPMCLPCKECNRARLKQTNYDFVSDERALKIYLEHYEEFHLNPDYQFYSLFEIHDVLIFHPSVPIQFSHCHALQKEEIVEWKKLPSKAFDFVNPHLMIWIRNPIDGIVSQYELFSKCPGVHCSARNVLVFLMERDDSIFYHSKLNRFYSVDPNTGIHATLPNCKQILLSSVPSSFLEERRPSTNHTNKDSQDLEHSFFYEVATATNTLS